MKRTLGVTSFLTFLIVSNARAADLQYPLSVATGPDGAIYVADKDAHGVWKIADGKLTPFSMGTSKFRTPLNAVRCVAVDAKGRLLAGDTATREVYRFSADGKPEPLTNGGIGMPMALAFDSKGDILVCDLELHQIVKVAEAGGAPVKIADAARPSGIAVDAQDRIWVVDSSGKDQVIRILPNGKTEAVVAGKLQQDPKVQSFPHNIALDKDQNAYICDNYGATVWKVGPNGKQQKWLADKPLVKPVGIVFAGDRLLIADPHAKQIFEATLDGMIAPLKFEGASK
ncbi:MAG: NHL repeat-containing protein [Planctomycetia bacterium]|nr:NHL repeat-containing protein [Planctomycetia bacterium]